LLLSTCYLLLVGSSLAAVYLLPPTGRFT